MTNDALKEDIKEVLEEVQKLKPEQKKKILYALKGAVLVSGTEDEAEAGNDDTE